MLAVFLYIVFCIILAYINYRLIINDRRIYHALNGLAHLAFWVIVYLTMDSLILTLAFPFIARLFFDVALNLFRGLPLDYVPKNPKSIADKVEKAVFGSAGFTPKLIWLIIIIALITIYYVRDY
jgi:ribose/xylose/arabinose/galactoside ABC-type transport system permease subunit